MFELISDYVPSGDQPKAIKTLTEGIEKGLSKQVLLGVTGSGKTFTMANVIANLNRPALVLAHNKTLAAQLCSEFKTFFPNNAVEYFVSYYDYYQPEAYIPARDAYIEKEADINEEIERLRHSATRSLILRPDTIIVASVSCIYGLGLPEDYIKGVIHIKVGQEISLRKLFLKLDQVQYQRNDVELKQGRYRVKGDTLDIFPSWEESILRIRFFGDEIEAIERRDPVDHHLIETYTAFDIFPATHYVVSDNLHDRISAIKKELFEREKELLNEGKLVEAHRIKSRTLYDMEMLAEIGYCKGIENYSRHLSNRNPGEAPGVLMDFFPKNFITFIDESHATVPQIRGMYNGDQSRKQTLVDHGFRLPSAKDNRPLRFEEFESKLGPCIYVSATPGPYELETTAKDKTQTRSKNWNDYYIAEQLIRPTGLVDPEVFVRPSENQIQDLLIEIQACVSKEERVLVTTLTKKFSEDLTHYLEKNAIKVQYLHSDITALDRIDILHDLRTGKYDVLIGVNLLREGLDLPEVSLVAILDADKEGFLRNERSLIQTMGRAARHINGKVILYGDKMTDSMSAAISETNRRRAIQLNYNTQHNIVPTTVHKKITDIRDQSREALKEAIESVQKLNAKSSTKEISKQIKKLESEMKKAADNLEFEVAAVLRDQLEHLKNR